MIFVIKIRFVFKTKIRFKGFNKIGGYDGLVRKYPNATTKAVYRVPNTTCHETDKYSFQVH